MIKFNYIFELFGIFAGIYLFLKSNDLVNLQNKMLQNLYRSFPEQRRLLYIKLVAITLFLVSLSFVIKEIIFLVVLNALYLVSILFLIT